MNVSSIFSYPNGIEHESDKNVFCTTENLMESLDELSEEFLSFGIASVTPDNNDDLQNTESLKQLSVKLIDSAWNLIHKHRLLMQFHEKTDLLNRKTYNDNVHLKNHITRLKEDVQKEKQALCVAKEKERKLKEHLENTSRDLKHEKEEVWKLKKQAQSKDVQHKHEVKRILQINQKLQERLEKSIGTFTPREKVLQKAQTNQEKEVVSFKKTISRLEENNRQMLEEINNLNETLDLHKEAINLQMQASGAWIDADNEKEE